ncbi:MAG: hypothetical protein QF915_06270 [Candidatus Woesearchaeota archaeon]|nr:hypothetical protein [Candidatus Woesearchaeota archaeon]MDP7458343.1 hypothetical protein [Candidatus Woesearchaeota archaeon]
MRFTRKRNPFDENKTAIVSIITTIFGSAVILGLSAIAYMQIKPLEEDANYSKQPKPVKAAQAEQITNPLTVIKSPSKIDLERHLDIGYILNNFNISAENQFSGVQAQRFRAYRAEQLGLAYPPSPYQGSDTEQLAIALKALSGNHVGDMDETNANWIWGISAELARRRSTTLKYCTLSAEGSLKLSNLIAGNNFIAEEVYKDTGLAEIASHDELWKLVMEGCLLGYTQRDTSKINTSHLNKQIAKINSPTEVEKENLDSLVLMLMHNSRGTDQDHNIMLLTTADNALEKSPHPVREVVVYARRALAYTEAAQKEPSLYKKVVDDLEKVKIAAKNIPSPGSIPAHWYDELAYELVPLINQVEDNTKIAYLEAVEALTQLQSGDRLDILNQSVIVSKGLCSILQSKYQADEDTELRGLESINKAVQIYKRGTGKAFKREDSGLHAEGYLVLVKRCLERDFPNVPLELKEEVLYELEPNLQIMMTLEVPNPQQ